MKIWITTDTHLGHQRMIEFGRPVDFEEKILKGLEVLKEDDILIHLGDVCFGNDIMHHERLFKVIKCKKWLLRGNHDKKSNTWYLSKGWDFVGERIDLGFNGKYIAFTHIPMGVLPEDVDFNIHGHLHDNLHRHPEVGQVLTDRHILLALEQTKYQPVPLETLLKDK